MKSQHPRWTRCDACRHRIKVTLRPYSSPINTPPPTTDEFYCRLGLPLEHFRLVEKDVEKCSGFRQWPWPGRRNNE